MQLITWELNASLFLQDALVQGSIEGGMGAAKIS